jgi:uncharacterized surface protein with fasciclin (FAS1) repeats
MRLLKNLISYETSINTGFTKDHENLACEFHVTFKNNYLPMNKKTKFSALLLMLLALLPGCTDKEQYYERPEWLEPPVYTVLAGKGNFTNYLKCVDRTLFAETLRGGGLYTVFAPNDQAFEAYLSSKGLTSVDQLSDSLVTTLVSYSIVYNAYTYDRLTDVLGGGWDSLTSIKKKTTYYEPIRRETVNNREVWVYDLSNFTMGDNNYKYVPMYLSRVFERNRSTAQAAADYGTFYTSTYTGKNIQSASVVRSDIRCENGVVHELDQVLEPLSTLEQLLNDDDYSLFRGMINKTGSTGENYFITYQYNEAATRFFQQAMPEKSIDQVYLKYYTDIAVNLNSERYGNSARQSEQGGFTLFAPNNAAVMKFYNEKLKDYYPEGLEKISRDVLMYFINAQMVDELLWPGDYRLGMNSLGEYFNGKGNRGEAFDPRKYSMIAPASNGFFYGSNDYIKSRFFETVFTEILLNQRYKLANLAFSEFFANTLREELMKCELNGYTQENYTVLLPSDSLLLADGFRWEWLAGSNRYGFSHMYSGSSMGNFDVNSRIQRLIRSHIFKRLKNEQVDCAITSFATDPAFASEYNGFSYAVNEYGDMVRYYTTPGGEQRIQMLGNHDENDWVVATPYKTFINGQVFKVDKLLQYSRRNQFPQTREGYYSEDLITYILRMTAAVQNPRVAKYKNYLVQCLKGDDSNDLAGLSADMVLTVFMPTNTAIDKAVADGHLPAYNLVTSGDVPSRLKATQFILHHIVKGKVFVDDGLPYIMPNREVIVEETWPTVLKDVVDNTYLAVRKTADGQLEISTQSNNSGNIFSQVVKSASVSRGVRRSNYFAAKAVLHEIDDYMVYERVIQ